jgi:hypothetical protein
MKRYLVKRRDRFTFTPHLQGYYLLPKLHLVYTDIIRLLMELFNNALSIIETV